MRILTFNLSTWFLVSSYLKLICQSVFCLLPWHKACGWSRCWACKAVPAAAASRRNPAWPRTHRRMSHRAENIITYNNVFKSECWKQQCLNVMFSRLQFKQSLYPILTARTSIYQTKNSWVMKKKKKLFSIHNNRIPIKDQRKVLILTKTISTAVVRQRRYRIWGRKIFGFGVRRPTLRMASPRLSKNARSVCGINCSNFTNTYK
jgi:hypothetical protein